MRKITAVRVIRNYEWQEWIVEAYADSVTKKYRIRYAAADYFTDDKNDAIMTACSMLGIPVNGWKKFPIRKIVSALNALAAIGE